MVLIVAPALRLLFSPVVYAVIQPCKALSRVLLNLEVKLEVEEGVR